jgi:hypothetical protein
MRLGRTSRSCGFWFGRAHGVHFGEIAGDRFGERLEIGGARHDAKLLRLGRGDAERRPGHGEEQGKGEQSPHGRLSFPIRTDAPDGRP